jgi:hypothetical protein
MENLLCSRKKALTRCAPLTIDVTASRSIRNFQSKRRSRNFFQMTL